MKYNKALALFTTGLLASSCATKHYPSDNYQQSYKELIAYYMQEADDNSKIEKKPLSNKTSSFQLKKEWWADAIQKNIFPQSVKESISPLSLYGDALKHSSQVKVFSALPLIRETSIREAEGRFDVNAFFEAQWADARQSRNSSSQTNRNIFHERDLSIEGGFQRRLETGGDFSVSQRISYLDNNSISLSPNAQTQAAFTLSLVQPLLKGAGLKYNKSIIEIAKIDHTIADHEFKRQIMTHLSEVNNTYWALYLARGQYLINKQLYNDTKAVAEKMGKRRNLDLVMSQKLQIDAALADRETALIRAEMAIKNTESRLKILVNSTRLKRASKLELLPQFHPQLKSGKQSLQQALVAALKNRPEIDQAFAQLKSLDIRKDMAENELLPQLNLILEASFHGLSAEKDYAQAVGDQWNQQSFRVGFSFDFPMQNRGAKARYLRRNLEYRQQVEQIHSTVDTILFEVKVSYRELETAKREVLARKKSLDAAGKELESMRKRWGLAEVKKEKGGTAYMQFLLDSQQRKSRAEQTYLNATVNYSLAFENMERSKGTLLSFNDIVDSPQQAGEHKLPQKAMQIKEK